MTLFLLPDNVPFLIALGLMLIIGGIELLALLVGLSVFEGIDDFVATHFEPGSGSNIFGQFLGWLYIGRAPLLVLIVLFLLGFSLAGLIGQWLLMAVTGRMLPPMIAVVPAVLTALPFVRVCGGLIARYMPRDESSAVSEDSFIGRTATFVGLPGSFGKPAEARLIDQHGATHYLLVEPDEETTEFSRGETVLVVSKVSGNRFRAIANPRPDLL